MDTECPICLEVITPLSEKILLVSEICEHKICDVCAEKQLASQGNFTQCAICRSHLTRLSFVPFDMSSIYYENHKEARKRVLQVYNDTRANFKNTPEYNKYLEDRESIIFDLINCKDDARLKEIEHELRVYERNNSLQISKNIEAQKSEHKKKIQSIVEKEDVFYEIVDKGAPFNLWKVDELLHPLKKSCPNYFVEDSAVISTGESKPMNAAIRSDSDIPRKVYSTRIELMESDTAGGYSKAIVSEKCKLQVFALLLWNIEH
ncbi:CDK-activating kinase assembly factor [Theileria orientalis]|uniref:CDK-activating kinase assembly factor n=1 Tax=Theileria orientalis TaxID=68886 RepID=A0A976QUM3_THEOR|nr:CDK-activating kinase assembly factor [Theileria orientalis]